ncbi:MAG: HU family DNA-binding protein [Gammaproteobacteria bacterium]|nr:MAG: HU family DNA-binding protein [Gammaproteobacteria bacterium]
MKKTDLAAAIADRTGLSRSKSREVLTALTDTMMWTLTRGEDVALTRFGRFSIVDRPARSGRHPQTGAPMRIEAHRAVVFRPGKALREAVSQDSGD